MCGWRSSKNGHVFLESQKRLALEPVRDEIERLLRRSDISVLENIAFALDIEEEIIQDKTKLKGLYMIKIRFTARLKLKAHT